MNTVFLFTIIFSFLVILVESVDLILQLKGKKLQKWLGKGAFRIHSIVVGIFWSVTFFLIVLLQFSPHPLFHNIIMLKYFGLVLLVGGVVLACWALRLLGLRRALCVNFFEKNIPVIRTSLYRYLKNPLDLGFWAALIGLALLTGSVYNLVIAVEFIVIMIPHIMLENIPIDL